MSDMIRRSELPWCPFCGAKMDKEDDHAFYDDL